MSVWRQLYVTVKVGIVAVGCVSMVMVGSDMITKRDLLPAGTVPTLRSVHGGLDDVRVRTECE